jgi:hypothetical protein
MNEVISKLGELTSGISDDTILLMARDVSWKVQVPDPDNEGQMIDNPDSINDYLAQRIMDTITQWAVNTQKADDDKEIADTIAQLQADKQQQRQNLLTSLVNKTNNLKTITDDNARSS